MSVFKTQCFFFLRNPRGGVEDLDRMQEAGFQGVFCNIGDFPPSDWEAIIRPRALQRGMFCGPWARTQDSNGGFSPDKLTQLVQCAKRWASPLIVNSESELKGTGSSWTTLIADMCRGYDAAVSVEPQPFADVEWWPLKEMPILPQIFPPAGSPEPDWAIEQWHAYGIECVYLTFASYGGMTPGSYDLNAPYSIYTADDCGGNYAAWSPTAFSYEGCVEAEGGSDMQEIGKQHGVEATYNRFKALDPEGCNPAFDPKQPDALPLEQLKAYDKWCRTMLILVNDHDDQAGRSVDWDDG